VIGVEPSPIHTTLIVIFESPCECFQIGNLDSMLKFAELRGGDSEFFHIVALFHT